MNRIKLKEGMKLRRLTEADESRLKKGKVYTVKRNDRMDGYNYYVDGEGKGDRWYFGSCLDIINTTYWEEVLDMNIKVGSLLKRKLVQHHRLTQGKVYKVIEREDIWATIVDDGGSRFSIHTNKDQNLWEVIAEDEPIAEDDDKGVGTFVSKYLDVAYGMKDLKKMDAQLRDELRDTLLNDLLGKLEEATGVDVPRSSDQVRHISSALNEIIRSAVSQRIENELSKRSDLEEKLLS